MKRVIAGLYVYLCVHWVGLNGANRCNETKKDISGPLLAWHNIRYLRFPLGLLLLIATYAASAATQLLFDSTVYTRDVGKPTIYLENLEIINTEGPYTLVVESGDHQTGADRVTSALIELNGVSVAKPNEFNSKVEIFEKPVQLQESNQLYVEIRGKPGAFIRLKILGEQQEAAGRLISEFIPTTPPLLYSTDILPTVVGSNREPDFFPVSDHYAVKEGDALHFMVVAFDPEGEPIEYITSGLPANSTFSAESGQFYWQPSYHQSGQYTVSFQVTDGSATTHRDVIIDVQDVNRPPEILPLDSSTVYVGDLVSLKVASRDPDNNPILLTVQQQSGSSSFSFEPDGYGTGNFLLDPKTADIGTLVFQFAASDGDLTDLKDLILTVKSRTEAENAPPGESGENVGSAQVPALVSLRVDPPSITVQTGETGQLNVVGVFSDGSTANLAPANSGTTYSIEDSNVATAEDSGEITGTLAHIVIHKYRWTQRRTYDINVLLKR